MAAGKKIIPALVNAAIFILMEVAALSLLHNNGRVQNFFISKWMHSFMAKTWGAAENVRYYFSLSGMNEDLASENFALARQVDYYKSLTGAEAPSGLTEVGDYRYLPASIVKSSRNKQHNYLIINKGSEDGVTPRSGLVSSCGVVGIVDAVSKHYSYAISFMNTEFSVSARLGREGSVGPLVWDGKATDGAVLGQIPLQQKFAPGDTVYTSGYSSIFPSDIPIGVVGDSKVVNGATYEIKVRLLQDFGALRFITVVSNKGREEISSLENREDD
ncbi:MAG: rod shape-determining protein MreC [Bacteroidales bacterium]|nr:rod shape-determining protein MreC [Bacteroidales bacterium]